MIRLTEEDKETIRHLGYPKSSKLSVGNFYIKCVTKASALKELFGEKVARDIFELKCPQSSIAVVDGNYYVLSKDLNEEGSFYTAEKLGITKNLSLSKIWQILKSDEREIIDIIKMYMFDVIFHNLDRKEDNWGFLYLPDNSRQVVIFDYDEILNNRINVVDEGSEKHLEIHTDSDNELSLYDDFKNFLLKFDPEFIKMYKTYFDILTPEYCKHLMEMLATENSIPFDSGCDFIPPFIDTLIKIYSCHYQRLKETYENVIERGDKIAR